MILKIERGGVAKCGDCRKVRPIWKCLTTNLGIRRLCDTCLEGYN